VDAGAILQVADVISTVVIVVAVLGYVGAARHWIAGISGAEATVVASKYVLTTAGILAAAVVGAGIAIIARLVVIKTFASTGVAGISGTAVIVAAILALAHARAGILATRVDLAEVAGGAILDIVLATDIGVAPIQSAKVAVVTFQLIVRYHAGVLVTNILRTEVAVINVHGSVCAVPGIGIANIFGAGVDVVTGLGCVVTANTAGAVTRITVIVRFTFNGRAVVNGAEVTVVAGEWRVVALARNRITEVKGAELAVGGTIGGLVEALARLVARLRVLFEEAGIQGAFVGRSGPRNDI